MHREKGEKVQPYIRPKCWDYNYTLVGDTIVTGQMEPSAGTALQWRICLRRTFSSVPDFRTNGEYNDDTHCGTYIEVHLPNITLGKFTGLYNKKQIEQVIIEVKLPPGLASGYRSIPLPTQYKDHPRRILCGVHIKYGGFCAHRASIL